MRMRTATVARCRPGRRGRGAGAGLRRQQSSDRAEAEEAGRRASRRSKSSPPATAPARPATPSWSRSTVENFHLAPRQFGREPQLGEGHLRFSLNRVPDCVDPEKLQDAINSPIGNGRLVGASFDYPALLRPQRRPRRADRHRRQLLAGDPAGDLLPRPPARLLPPDRQPRPEQRRDDARSTPSPTSRSCPAPATARNRARRAKSRAPRPPPASSRAPRSSILHFV